MLKKLIMLVFLMTGLSLAGCAAFIPVSSFYQDFSIPPLNQEVTKSIGEELLSQGKMAVIPAIEILCDTPSKDVTVGVYKMIGTINSRSLYVPIPSTSAYIKKTSWYPKVYIAHSERDGTYCRGGGNDLDFAMCENTISADNIKATVISVVSQNSYQQSLIYTGKQDNIVKFLYREYKDDIARPAFNVDVTYDLKDSNEISFRDAKLKIIKVTNSSITYVVLKNFTK